MTPIVKWIKGVVEKVTGRFYEGPEAPERLRLIAADFANRFPRATREEWVEFASGLAAEAYRTGWTRGFEYTERTHDWRGDIPPEVLADWLDPSWKEDGRGIQIREAGAVVPDEPMTEEEAMREHVDEMILASSRRA